MKEEHLKLFGQWLLKRLFERGPVSEWPNDQQDEIYFGAIDLGLIDSEETQYN